MISRNFYVQIIFRVALLVAAALCAGFAVASESNFIAFVCLATIIPVVINLIQLLNITNRKMSYFLESIQNNDSTLIFPTQISG